jgi:hypothetical protein
MSIEHERKTNSWAVHGALVLQRLVVGALIWGSMPLAHARWGAPYPGDGQKALGMVLAFSLISGCAMLAYFVVASVLHYILRKKRWRYIATVDGGIGVVLVLVLLFAGVSATYSEEPIQSSTAQRP